MDSKEWVTIISAIAGGLGIVTTGISASWSFYQKAKESIQSRRQARQGEILRLQAELTKVQEVFFTVFDYYSPLDNHLRIQNLNFESTEAQTRIDVDKAFEHLRDLHRSVILGLIEVEDIGPWVYWIYRVQTRDAIRLYAEACGYGSFLDDLNTWSQQSKELQYLKEKCPWLHGVKEGL